VHALPNSLKVAQAFRRAGLRLGWGAPHAPAASQTSQAVFGPPVHLSSAKFSATTYTEGAIRNTSITIESAQV